MKTPCHRNYRVSLTGCSPVHSIWTPISFVTGRPTVECTVTVILGNSWPCSSRLPIFRRRRLLLRPFRRRKFRLRRDSSLQADLLGSAHVRVLEAGGDHDRGALAMSDIPVHLQRRFEQRWAARFGPPAPSTAPKNLDLKRAVHKLPRLQKQKKNPPGIAAPR
jgi:hypothetical protein